MKKVLAMLLVFTMLIPAVALGDGMGVQLISGPEPEAEPVSLDDFKLGSSVTIEGYGILTGTIFEYVDVLRKYESGYDFSSGEEAEYAILRIDILNTSHKAKNFLANCEVRVIYDDSYEYGGWFYQYNYDKSKDKVSKDTVFEISPMYEGHYCFGCTLPNAVVKSKLPLKMIIKIDGNEITYNIRK